MAQFSVAVDETGEATRIVRRGMLLVLVFFGSLIAWGALVPIEGAIIAEGVVKIESKRKTVQHLEGGVIREILVREGDTVAEGQPLVILEDAEVRASLNIFQDQLNVQLAKEARLLAERKFASTIEFPEDLRRSNDPKIREILRTEETLFLTKKKALDEELAGIQAEQLHAKEEEAGIEAEIASALESIRYKEERARSGELLSAKQYIQRNELLQLKEAVAEKKEQLGYFRATLAVNRQRQKELELRVLSLRNSFVKAADDELKETRRSIYELRERIHPAEVVTDRFRVVAPIAGRVLDLQVTTVGGVVRPGEALMDIVPANRTLMVEAKLMPRDKDMVYVGQKAEVQLISLKGMPFVNGTVTYVAEDALADKYDPSRPSFYLTHIRVDAEHLKSLGQVTIFPGMPVTTYLRTTSRTFFELVFKPITDAAQRGLRQDL